MKFVNLFAGSALIKRTLALCIALVLLGSLFLSLIIGSVCAFRFKIFSRRFRAGCYPEGRMTVFAS